MAERGADESRLVATRRPRSEESAQQRPAQGCKAGGRLEFCCRSSCSSVSDGRRLLVSVEPACPSGWKEIERSEVGTSGGTEGGLTRIRRPDNARDEIKVPAAGPGTNNQHLELHTLQRGDDGGPAGPNRRRDGDCASGNTFWVRDGDRKFADRRRQGRHQ